MNKKELIKSVIIKSNSSPREVTAIVNALVDTIIETINREEPLRLMGLGTFSIKNHVAHNGFNPVTKTIELFPAKKSVKFKPGKRIVLE